MKKYALVLGLALSVLFAPPVLAALSAKAAFTLLQQVPPGEYLPDAMKFLGVHAADRVVDSALGIKVTRWGKDSDTWVFDVLHDEDTVRATRITWRTKSRAEQQTIFSQLTTEGKNFFGKTAAFRGTSEAEWKDFKGERNDFDGRWIVRAKIETEIKKGVTLLSGIRDVKMDSERFGF